jgi:hypothetical protein
VPIPRIARQRGHAQTTTLENPLAASFFAERDVDPRQHLRRASDDALQKMPRD